MDKAKIAQYRKSIVAGVGLAATIGASFAPDNKYVIAGIAIATAFGVYRVPNVPQPKPAENVVITYDGPTGS